MKRALSVMVEEKLDDKLRLIACVERRKKTQVVEEALNLYLQAKEEGKV